MPRNVSIPTVIDAALKGIARAQADYKNWSGGYWLWQAPEYFSGTYIAQAIAAAAGKTAPWYLTMEHGARHAMAEAGAAGKGRLHSRIRAAGRFDLLLWWADDTPRAPIEVKCQVTDFKRIRADVERLDKVIHRKRPGTSFQFGMSVFYTSAKDRSGAAAKRKVAGRVAAIVRDAKAHVSEGTVVTHRMLPIKVDEDSAWTAVALVLKLRAKT